MERITLFHGSVKIVDKPFFGGGSFNNDYGRAFYCTKDIYSAKEWANKSTDKGYVNKYAFDGRGLRVLDLTDKNKYSPLHWIAILLHYRELDPSFVDIYKKELNYLKQHYYIDISSYDVVIGFRADDSYFKFPLMFVRGEIRLERLVDIYNLGYLGTQIAIISEKAFQRLSFIESIEVEAVYREKYRSRILLADERFHQIAKEERWLEGTRLQDLVKKDDQH